MIPIAHKICFSLLIVAMLVFFYCYYHSLYINDGVHSLSWFIVSITSLFSTTSPAVTPSFEAPGFSVYEDRAVLIMFVFAVFLAFISMCIAMWHRVKFGVSHFFVPLVFASLGVASCIIIVGVELGLYTHA